MRILISSNPENLKAVNPDITVEAEYGKVVVEGRLLTLAHHGDRGHNAPPSQRPNERVQDAETIGVSHIDLDTLGGIMSVCGDKPEAPSFWKLAGFVDVNGAHKLGESGASDDDLRRLYAYWAGSESIKIYPPRDGSVLDITDDVTKLVDLVAEVLVDNDKVLKSGDAFKEAQNDLNHSSFIRMLENGVILRQASNFVNHLYVTPDGQVGRAIVTHNPSEDLPGGAITASLADPIDGVNIGDLLGDVFGSEAGGQPGIGGSERGIARPMVDAEEFAQHLIEEITAKA